MSVFSVRLVSYCPSNLLYGSPPPPPPPPPPPRGGGGVLSFDGGHILQEYNNLFLKRFRTYKIALPPQTKTYEGRGPQTDKHLPKSPFSGKFF
jgi:hypothetical protein